ncbi:DNA-binding response regulator [candidate division WWE3 bacterium CG10_big_fil_rev_8_21_14_0_10_32_10]|uniref:DNA-binding response regulator n=1 Tax=candidate division WWE3 bacterium CG10_big_fil_rev_8_21_14_0_10_32_10 TaxID=1975090 RepID=A0A2H0RAZ1_UNCKA|nr:MAG: DNA-binding response regulator [candidate division WWE3 bacterium CG10_big_fil_rev_8_21_14_0_10_32_10]
MKILVVEDEHKIATSLKKGLEQENFAVDIAFDGEVGYDFAVSGEYDCIILDLMLPKMDGVEICKNLRKENINTPILMLTAKSELEDKIKGLNTGADDYITKPFAFEELLARIKAILRRPNKTIGNVLKCQDLEMDTVKYKVTRDNKEISLSKKEYEVLEYLLRNKGNIISKDLLIERVWDYEADILPNTVEQYITYLRNKIDKPFKNKPSLIHTVRGFGYKLM